MDSRTERDDISAFIDQARLRYATSQSSMKGNIGLKMPQRMQIRAAAVSYDVARSPIYVDEKTRSQLLERFEELCRRHHIEIPAAMRPAILENMLTELWVNKQALKEKDAGRLVSATAYWGAVGPKLIEEFPDLSGTPSIFRQAMIGHPSNPRIFLQRAQANFAMLMADEEFASFRDTPFIFRRAIYDRNPTEFLRGVKQNIAMLKADKEFADCKPSLLIQVALHFHTDPRGYLRSKMREDGEHVQSVKGRRRVALGSDEPHR